MKLLRAFVIAFSLPFSFAAVAADQTPWAQGTIKKIAGDKATIAHGPIDSVGMGPMTMQFPVKDSAGLAKLKAGDKVRFQAIMAGGEIVVTRIEPAK
ncbi:MAG: copper-binding protein [Gammaproteobacteria bacterium]|nr:copper-binding protein [Gammaproteobacteria bacterium]MBU1414393.1 copper-binding protein [Gammaproteobacteria bacterium]